MPKLPGVLKGLGVTFGTIVQTTKPKRFGGGAATVQYPHEKEAPPTRARGVIALREEISKVVQGLRIVRINFDHSAKLLDRFGLVAFG